jgi:hypothetical protein
MASPQIARRPLGRPLEAGDIAPAFRLAGWQGEAIDPAADHIAGKPLLLLFSGMPVTAEIAGIGRGVSDLGGRAILVAATGEHAQAEGYETAIDADGSAHASLGAESGLMVLIAPNRHVAYVGKDPVAASEAVARIAAGRQTVAMQAHPPVLIVPDVLSRQDCQRLINVFAMQGHVFAEPGHGREPPGNGDYKQRIPEYGRKDRIDHWIRQPETNAFIDERMSRRLFPEIMKSFQYRITKREGYRIGSYEGERGGELHGHRDNSKPAGAHRRFACSINLNTEQFEGGELRFPEFGNQLYRPETGAAIVFSCSLLHEPLHVTKGKRFVLLAFLFGDT